MHCLNGDEKYLDSPRDKLEATEGLLNPQPMGPMNSADAEENASFGAESSFDASLLKANFEGLLMAKSQETLTSNARLQAVFQLWEFEFQKQKQLMSQQQQEIQNLREMLIAERDSRSTQLLGFQETIRVMKHEIGQLRHDVKHVPATFEDNLTATIALATGQLFCHQRRLDKDLRECRIQLESAKQAANLKTSDSEKLNKDLRECRMQLESATQAANLKTGESVQLTENNMLHDEANTQLKPKLDKIQEELCKEGEGHHGFYIHASMTPLVWKSVADEMFFSINTFTSLLSQYKDSKGDYPAKSSTIGSELWSKVRTAQSQHWIYLLEATICNGLFKDFEYESFLRVNSNVLFLNQEQRMRMCSQYYENSKRDLSSDKVPASNGKRDRLDLLFCPYLREHTYLLPTETRQLSIAFRDYHELIKAVQSKTHQSEIDATKQRLLVSLIIASKKAWNFHKLCLSFDPPATIFRVARGDPFNAEYMESIDTPGHTTLPTVGCMVYPGFRLQKFIIKCKVYLKLKT